MVIYIKVTMEVIRIIIKIYFQKLLLFNLYLLSILFKDLKMILHSTYLATEMLHKIKNRKVN